MGVRREAESVGIENLTGLGDLLGFGFWRFYSVLFHRCNHTFDKGYSFIRQTVFGIEFEVVCYHAHTHIILKISIHLLSPLTIAVRSRQKS